MLPPRLLPPLRPCYPPWSAVQIRCASESAVRTSGRYRRGDRSGETTSQTKSKGLDAPEIKEDKALQRKKATGHRSSISHRNGQNLFRLTGSDATSQQEKDWLEWRERKRLPGGKNDRGLQVNRLSVLGLEKTSMNSDGFVEETSSASLQNRVIAASEHPNTDAQRLIRGLHTHARDGVSPPSTRKGNSGNGDETSSASHSGSRGGSNSTGRSLSQELSEQSLLEELFPEVSSYIQPHYHPRHPYPKLDLPRASPLVRRQGSGYSKSYREKIQEAFHSRGEQVTALQLVNCSTELTESDFRRLIPKGKHIDSWVRDGQYEKVIPGRDPLSLERLPFYYLLFKSPEAALSYQNNAARLHKLSSLHQPSNIFSAIPPPRGFLEDGEDVAAATSSYLLKSPSQRLNLNMVMQPYNASLRAILDNGGYKPIVPFVDSNGHKVWKVLLHIEGWEPSPQDLYYIFMRHAYDRGLTWPFCGGERAIHRLRDLVDVKSKLLPISSSNPRAANPEQMLYHDPSFDFLKQSDAVGDAATRANVSQMVMNRMYNRWIVEFSDEDASKRFARMWNRRVLPLPKTKTWRDTEEIRMVNAEHLW